MVGRKKNRRGRKATGWQGLGGRERDRVKGRETAEGRGKERRGDETAKQESGSEIREAKQEEIEGGGARGGGKRGMRGPQRRRRLSENGSCGWRTGV